MKLALAIETSGRTGSVVLTADDKLLGEDHFPQGLKHAAELIPRIDALLRSQDFTPKDITEIYVSVGPGSFTGLRIGITFSKTLAWTTGARLVAVPSLRVIAENLDTDIRHALVLLDAKRGQIFTARFERDEAGSWTEREPAQLDRLTDAVARAPRPIHLTGQGLSMHAAELPVQDDLRIAPASLWEPSANVVANLGADLARRGEFIRPDQLLPLYVRKAEAQEKWEAEHA